MSIVYSRRTTVESIALTYIHSDGSDLSGFGSWRIFSRRVSLMKGDRHLTKIADKARYTVMKEVPKAKDCERGRETERNRERRRRDTQLNLQTMDDKTKKLLEDCDRPACDEMTSMFEKAAEAAKHQSKKKPPPSATATKKECPAGSAQLGRSTWTLLHSMVRVNFGTQFAACSPACDLHAHGRAVHLTFTTPPSFVHKGRLVS